MCWFNSVLKRLLISFLSVLSLHSFAFNIDNHPPILNGMTIESPSTSSLVESNLDVDGDQRYDALTDGLLILRSMFGLSGDALISGAISDSAAYSSSAEIELRIDRLESFLDVDDNGVVDALTDGLIILRYLFGLRGEDLISNAIATDAQRSSAYQISSFVSQLVSLNIEACSNSPLRFYQMPNLANGASYSLEGQDKDLFEISSDGFLSFSNPVPSSSQDGDDIFEVGIKQEGSNINDEIRWLSITLVPGYAVEVMQLFPGKNSLLRLAGNKLIAKGVLYSPSRELSKGDINDLSVNSIMVTDIEEINGDILWSVELTSDTSSIDLTASAECGNIADSYLFSQNVSDAYNPIGNMVLDEENNRIFAVNQLPSASHYYVSYDLTTSMLSDFTEKSKFEEFVSWHGYSTGSFSFNPSSGDILTYRSSRNGSTAYRTNINSDEITAMEQTLLYSDYDARIVPVSDNYSQAAWIMAGQLWDAENKFHNGLLTVTVNPNAQNYFQVWGYVPYDELDSSYGFLVDPLDKSIFLPKRLPDSVKPFVTPGESIQHINAGRYFSYRADNKLHLYNVDTSEQTVLVDLSENPPPDMGLSQNQGYAKIAKDGNSVYFTSQEKFTVFDVPTKKYNVIFNGFGDPSNALQGKINGRIVLANSNKTLVTTYGYDCEAQGNTFGAKKIAAIDIKSGADFYDEVLGCDSGFVKQGYHKKNKILLLDGDAVVSVNLNNGNKTTLITFSEQIIDIDLDENDLKLYLMTSSHLHILDMNTKSLIASREFSGTPVYNPSVIQKNNITSAFYVSLSNGDVFEFKEDSLTSEPTKIINSSDGGNRNVWQMQYSRASNSLYFSFSETESTDNFPRHKLTAFSLDNLNWTTHKTHDNKTYYDDFIIDDNLGFIYFKQGEQLNLYDILDSQTSLIMN
jgi:hypothetical protein